MKHRREQEKVISTNEANFDAGVGRQQFFKVHRGINPAETTAKNDDSAFAASASYPDDHRVPSLTGVWR
jgi:hypothetical protein